MGKVTLAVALLAPALALATPDWVERLSLSGTISSDIRFNVEDYRGPIKGEGFNFAVNRNDLTLHAEFTPVEQVIAVVDARLRFYGLSDFDALPQLSNRARIDPFNVELDQAYVAVRGVPFSWLDLKIGRMVQTWGSADLFNPVDNLNARDFFDPMDYARKVPNQMIEVSVYPKSWLTITGVFIPTFKPSQLPPSAVLGFAVNRDKAGCLLDAPAPPLRDPNDGAQLADTFGSIDPCSLNFADPEVRALAPATTFANAQAAVRAQLSLGELEIAGSYYYGRFTFPVAYTAIANTGPSSTQPGKVDVAYIAEVIYPRMQVAGLDFSYSAPWLLDIGIVGEIALIFPEQVNFGMRAYLGSAKILEFSSVNVPADPFIKATLGVDYTFTKWLYVNAMFVHGFFDEFNDLYGLHNYVVFAAELKFWNDNLQLRLSMLQDVTDGSSVGNPQLTWIVVPGVEVLAGLFLFGGHTVSPNPIDYAARSKFGQRAAGRSQAFVKARFTW